MLRLKGCPKCKGTVALDRDHYGWYELCLQCGYHRDLETIVQVERRLDMTANKTRWGQPAIDEMNEPAKDFCLSASN